MGSLHRMYDANMPCSRDTLGTSDEPTPKARMNAFPSQSPDWSLALRRPAAAILCTLFVTSCVSGTAKNEPAPPEPSPDSQSAAQTPDQYCASQGGKYLGDMRCRLSNGVVAPMLGGAEAARAYASSVSVLAPNQAWLLATTALTFAYNGKRLDTVTGEAATPDAIEAERKQLGEWWDIHSEADLHRTLDWLMVQGHRAEFDELGARVSALNDEQFAALRSQMGHDVELVNKLDVVRAHYREVGTKSILAWDLIRYISLCRWGVLAGYMFEADAWRQIMPAAQQLQLTFDSWQDLQTNYLIGREFWSLEQTKKTGARFRAAFDKLSEDPSSPWNAIPWDTPLDIRRVMPGTR